MKILYAASEAVPFSSSGGLGDVAGSLPKAIRNRHAACRVVTPLYDTVPAKLRSQMECIARFQVPLSWRIQDCAVYRLTYDGVVFYFLQNDYYFSRGRLYGEFDDGERFAFFSKAALEMLFHIDFKPDIIHCNDWQAAMIPAYLNLFYRGSAVHRPISTVFTIHNIQFQGKFSMDFAEDVLGVPEFQLGMVEYHGSCNLMKAAVEQSNLVTTVSPSYAVELLDPWYAFGLDRLLRENRQKFSGILNGIDTRLYNPASDPALYQNFSPADLGGKKVSKRELEKAAGLEQGDRPLIAMVTRLTRQKGIDLVRYAFDELIEMGCSFVLLGAGDEEHERFFAEAAGRYPGRVSTTVGFRPELSHRIYAGADLFLMPSLTEPCGLAQMIAMRYGTIPIVRKTGGLRDTVADAGDGGCGYTFESFNAHDMLGAVRRAVAGYEDREAWDGLIRRAMSLDFGWGPAAEQYIRLYEKLVS